MAVKRKNKTISLEEIVLTVSSFFFLLSYSLSHNNPPPPTLFSFFSCSFPIFCTHLKEGVNISSYQKEIYYYFKKLPFLDSQIYFSSPDLIQMDSWPSQCLIDMSNSSLYNFLFLWVAALSTQSSKSEFHMSLIHSFLIPTSHYSPNLFTLIS